MPGDVGYGKPPRKNQFKPGTSGNPKGRPKGAKNLSTLVDKAINERVAITENGRRRTISKLEAAVKQLVNKSAAGDHKSTLQLFQLVQILESQKESAATVVGTHMGEDDRKVLANILGRVRRNASAHVGEDDDNSK